MLMILGSIISDVNNGKSILGINQTMKEAFDRFLSVNNHLSQIRCKEVLVLVLLSSVVISDKYHGAGIYCM